VVDIIPCSRQSFPQELLSSHNVINAIDTLMKRKIGMNKIILFLVTLLAATGLMLTACITQGNSAGLAGTSWKLVSYGPVGQQTPAAAGIETSLEFGTDGHVNGNVGCNSFGGNYEIKNGKILFSQMISTMMACQGPQMDQERATLKVLNGTARFQVQGNTLTIVDMNGASAINLSR
jgi:heat shock protein HslJ